MPRRSGLIAPLSAYDRSLDEERAANFDAQLEELSAEHDELTSEASGPFGIVNADTCEIIIRTLQDLAREMRAIESEIERVSEQRDEIVL